jgi:hypothetical protein
LEKIDRGKWNWFAYCDKGVWVDYRNPQAEFKPEELDRIFGAGWKCETLTEDELFGILL